MKQPNRILTGLVIVLALISLTGVCAADSDSIDEGNRPEPLSYCSHPWGNWSDDSDSIPTYDGNVGPGSPLYGLKRAFEDLDESFTFNETERLNKQMNHAKLRLSEVKRELALNKNETMEEALQLYQEKLNATQLYLDIMSSSSQENGILHAQEMVTKHQMVLECLMLAKPNNTGLARAYNNSLALEKKFEQKTQNRIERVAEKNNKTVLKAVRLTLKEQKRTENLGENQTISAQLTERIRQGAEDKNRDTENTPGNAGMDDKGNKGGNQDDRNNAGNADKNDKEDKNTGNQADNSNNGNGKDKNKQGS